jgi:FAD/FMN-containing dehydrogenase
MGLRGYPPAMITRRLVIASALATMARLGNNAAAAAVHSAAGTADPLAGKVFFKGDERYEALRQAATWNARKPNRFPNAIVMAQNEADVVAAVKLAKERGWQVSARSGGHSWSAAHTRNNSVQVNLARMLEIDVDPDARIAKISPSVSGNALNKKLREDYNLFTPSAHGVNVGMGGFVLAGGHGWNSRSMGLGCENLQALDVVTAEGKLIHASGTENSDYFWAARGSGPGYFGVATRYYLKVYPRPKVMQQSGYVYGGEDLEAVLHWIRTALTTFPLTMEAVMIIGSPKGTPTITVAATCFEDSAEKAKATLAVLDTCPVAGKALSKWANVDVILPQDVEGPTEGQPTGARHVVDNFWTNASAAELAPLLRKVIAEFPTPQSHIFWMCWNRNKKLPDMAYSVQADVFVAVNAVYYDPADDARCGDWAVNGAKLFDSISVGGQMNDENTERHWARYLSDEASRRLESMRTKYDPAGRFPGFLRS